MPAIDRLNEEREPMAPPPDRPPDTDRRWVLRVPPDPYLRFDTCDYSLDPAGSAAVSRRGSTEREVLAVARDSGELACHHPRSFARHRTMTALKHGRAIKTKRAERRPSRSSRPLARYDARIA